MTSVPINSDTLIQDFAGNWVPAGDFIRYFGGAPTQDGHYLVPEDTSVLMPDGSSQASAGALFAASLGLKPQSSSEETQDKTGSARASAALLLRSFGLEELIPIVDQWIRSGMSWEEVQVQLYDTSTAAGKVFDRKFPEIRLRREKGLQPMSVQEIQTYRTQAKQLFRAAGMPEGFYDSPDDFTSLMTNDISPQELEQRVMNGYVAVMSAPAEVRSELERLYGVDSGHLVAYFLDPEKATTVIQRDVAAAKIGGAAVRTGFGQVTGQEAERLASLDVTDTQAEQGFSTLANSKELGMALDRGEDTISREEQMSAVFEGNAQAGEKLSRRARRRLATFQGGGQLASSRDGFSGLSTT